MFHSEIGQVQPIGLYGFVKDFQPLLAVTVALFAALYAYRSARVGEVATRRNLEQSLRRERMAFLIMFHQRLIVAAELLKERFDRCDTFREFAKRTSDGVVFDLTKIRVTWTQVDVLGSIGETSGIAAILWKDLSTLETAEQHAFQFIDLQLRGCDNTFASLKQTAERHHLVRADEFDKMVSAMTSASDAIIGLTKTFQDTVERLGKTNQESGRSRWWNWLEKRLIIKHPRIREP